MKCETPKLIEFMPAIKAIQSVSTQPPKCCCDNLDDRPTQFNEHCGTAERKGGTMKYETPELTLLPPAMNAIESYRNQIPKVPLNGLDSFPVPQFNEHVNGYADWE